MPGKYALPEGMQREGLRVEEGAALLGCGRTKVFDLIKQGRLRVVKLGTRTIIPRSEVLRLLAEATGSDPCDAENPGMA